MQKWIEIYDVSQNNCGAIIRRIESWTKIYQQKYNYSTLLWFSTLIIPSKRQWVAKSRQFKASTVLYVNKWRNLEFSKCPQCSIDQIPLKFQVIAPSRRKLFSWHTCTYLLRRSFILYKYPMNPLKSKTNNGYNKISKSRRNPNNGYLFAAHIHAHTSCIWTISTRRR